MKKIYKKKSGFTLIEVIIYIALFSIVIGGGMIATYQIIESTDAGTNHTILQDEANFLLRKINWALVGATSFTAGTSLSIVKDGSILKFDLSSNNLRLTRGVGSPTILNSGSVTVSELSFNPTESNGITTTFTLTTAQNGRDVSQSFTTTKYLRQ